MWSNSSSTILCMQVQSFSHVQFFVTPRTLAHQTALSIIQYYPARILEWLPFPLPGDLLDPPIKLTSPVVSVLAGRFSSTEQDWEAQILSWMVAKLKDTQSWAELSFHKIVLFPFQSCTLLDDWITGVICLPSAISTPFVQYVTLKQRL